MKCSALHAAVSAMFLAHLAGPVAAQSEGATFTNCLIRAAERTELSSAVQDIVSVVYVEIGDEVSQGDRLIDLNHAALQARLQRLENEIAFAQRAQARGEQLGTLLPAAERDELSNAVARARADAAEVRAERNRYILVAPHDGIVVEAPVAVGELATDQSLMTLINVATLRAEISIPASRYGTFRVGQQLVLTSETGQAKRGTVAFVDPTIDFGSRTFRLHVSVDNRDGSWIAGQACSGEI